MLAVVGFGDRLEAEIPVGWTTAARRIEQLQANLDSIDVTLSAEQIKKLDNVSKPKLNFPAENNEILAPMIGFPDTTVDGRTVPSASRLNTVAEGSAKITGA